MNYLRERLIQQRFPHETGPQHRTVPTNVAVEILGRDAATAPVDQRLELPMVGVHPAKAQATRLAPPGRDPGQTHEATYPLSNLPMK